ncbi:hypothetical protein [Curtobacterium sp. Leaf261]|uniref:hypothetical protein n=1 Tax=Curtobacterium sp. Leaf261 TaxID=1736311 RepID=UPI000B2428E3|nr:hypothetical protein [Curtobacterium sp. Leaf261]
MSREPGETLAAWQAALAELEAAAGIAPKAARDAVANVGSDGGSLQSGDASDGRPGAASPVPPVRWSTPTDLGPLPSSLAGRVERLLAVQRDAIARVDEARRAVLGHLGALGRVEESREPSRSVYLDVTG